MGCIALVRSVLVLRCGLVGVVWCGIRTQAEAVVWLGWYGIRMQAEAGYHTTPTKPQRNTNTLRTRAIQPMK